MVDELAVARVGLRDLARRHLVRVGLDLHERVRRLAERVERAAVTRRGQETGSLRSTSSFVRRTGATPRSAVERACRRDLCRGEETRVVVKRPGPDATHVIANTAHLGEVEPRDARARQLVPLVRVGAVGRLAHELLRVVVLEELGACRTPL